MEEQIKSIFMKTLYKLTYYFNPRHDGDITYSKYDSKEYLCYRTEFIGLEKFYEKVIERPPFDVYDKVYINELDLTTSIQSKVRTTNGEIIYYTSEHEYIKEGIEEAQKEKERFSKMPWYQQVYYVKKFDKN